MGCRDSAKLLMLRTLSYATLTVLFSAGTLCLAKCNSAMVLSDKRVSIEEAAQKLAEYSEHSGAVQLVRQSKLTSTWLLQTLPNYYLQLLYA